jgi:hypothetical protein
MSKKDWVYKDFGDYSVDPLTPERGHFDLYVTYIDEYGEDYVSLDAVEVYKNLKEYFKGTEYE